MAFRFITADGTRGTVERVQLAPALPAGFWWHNESALGRKPLWRMVPDPTQAGEDSEC